MKTVSIDKFITELRSISEADFTIGTVYNFVKENPVDSGSLQSFLFFSQKTYTRNLIFKNNLFELLALCWDVGQCSRIHNHYGQNCWMSVTQGKLRVQDFRSLEQDDKSGYCRIEKTDSFDINRHLPAGVDPGEPIHQVLNLPEFNERAVSLHIYSKPFDRCLIYAPQKNQYSEVQLTYSSEYGKLCAGIEL